MINIEKVQKRFSNLEVLKNINLTLKAGECVALIGPNGCGKTTLIKSILGMVIPDSGLIEVDGIAIKGEYAYRQKVGYMPQIGKYPYNMTVGQILDLIIELRDSPHKMDQDLMQHFKIESMLHKRMGNLSGGTVQKVSATLAFLFNPDILILDEPTAGLDPISAEILKEKISTVKQEGKLVLITSHMLSELDDLVSHIVFMQDGEILFNHPTEQIKMQTGEQKISKAIAGMLKKSTYTN